MAERKLSSGQKRQRVPNRRYSEDASYLYDYMDVPEQQVQVKRPKVNRTSSDTPRKKRGNLPQSAISLLKRWLETHKDHPYPTDEEKFQLGAQTGLKIMQIVNWFINARRRYLANPPKRRGKNTTNHRKTPAIEYTSTIIEDNSETNPDDQDSDSEDLCLMKAESDDYDFIKTEPDTVAYIKAGSSPAVTVIKTEPESILPDSPLISDPGDILLNDRCPSPLFEVEIPAGPDEYTSETEISTSYSLDLPHVDGVVEEDGEEEEDEEKEDDGDHFEQQRIRVCVPKTRGGRRRVNGARVRGGRANTTVRRHIPKVKLENLPSDPLDAIYLPEQAVRLLRKWYNDHRSYPFPSDQEKLQLMEEANLTENQVTNWFMYVRRLYLQNVLMWKRNSVAVDFPDQSNENTQV